jgi:DHA2 family multidrug resistance protein
MPGGIATAVTAIICGRLLTGARPLVDARILIFFGIALFVVAMWQLGHLTTAAGESDARWPLIVRGAALGFLFTPINQAAYGDLDPRIAQQASGLINLARQLGGSFGIAVLASFLDSRAALHRTDLVTNLYSTNPAFVQRQHAAAAAMVARGYPQTVAQQLSMKIMDLAVTKQATMLSYNDAWMLILMSFVLVAPAVLILKKPGGHGPAVDAH